MRNKRNMLICTLIFCFVFCIKVPVRVLAQADEVSFVEIWVNEPRLKADGKTVQLNVSPSIYNDRIFIPLREVMEVFGCDVTWEAETQEMTVRNEKIEARLRIGDSEIKFTQNGKLNSVVMDVCPTIKNNYTMIPLRFIADVLDYDTFWEANRQKATIAKMGWGAKKIGIGEMKEYLSRSGKIDNGSIIAIIDTGVDCEHAYLKNRIVSAYNAVDKSSDVSDIIGHGTHVAGIIANCTPKNIKIMPIKVSSESGTYSTKAIVEGIQYAVNHGAKVINISLQKSIVNHDYEIANAIDGAIRKNCAVVVSAGNEKGDTADYTPSCLNNVIVVTAVDKNGEIYQNANTGESITVSAPGVGIVSSEAGDMFGSKDGTSMAAPFVSAAAAMIMMDIPNITPEEIKNLMVRYSEDRYTKGWDKIYGGGILDLSQYVINRENGIIEDFTVSAKERMKQLDMEIAKIREEISGAGWFQERQFAIELTNKGVRLYKQKDYFAAGYFFENAIINGDCENGLSKNNLSYMIRKGLYVSNFYTLDQLLSDAEAVGQTMAYVNRALLEASMGNWEKADAAIRKLTNITFYFGDIIEFWGSQSSQNDVEGDLVLGWLMRYGVYNDTEISQKEHLDRALKNFNVPYWMYERAI